ncbi:MAG: hypothetical protein M3173_08380 [Chloroflexota bacterium]|nr:hypothetical protein [Chloroflexota bacterium]
MREALEESAARYARRAARAYLDGQWSDFFADAGVALEHLAKALLASYHPTLVVGGGGRGMDFLGLLRVTGFGHRLPPNSGPLRTIGCTEAVGRVEVLLPGVRKWRKELQAIVEARNGVLHMAHAEATEASTALTALALASEVMLDALGSESGPFWGEYSDAVRALTSQKATELEQRVQSKLAQARVRFGERFGDDDKSAALAAIRAVQRARVVREPEEQELECPACGSPGVVEGYTEVREEADWDHDGDYGFVTGVSLILHFFPAAFACAACDLVLEDAELVAAGVNDDWELDDEVDPGDYYEPDEDMYRDR